MLASATMNNDLLNQAETSNGRTPLFIACINENLPIVKLLLEAEAERRLCSLAGRTEKEHAVFRGHMEVATLLVASESGDYEDLLSSRALQARIVRPKESLRCTLKREFKVVSLLEPPETTLSFSRLQRDRSQIICHPMSNQHKVHLKSIDLTNQLYDLSNSSGLSVRSPNDGDQVCHYL